MSRSLTDNKIKPLKSKEKPYKTYDGNGLYIEVAPSGSKLWRLNFIVKVNIPL